MSKSNASTEKAGEQNPQSIGAIQRLIHEKARIQALSEWNEFSNIVENWLSAHPNPYAYISENPNHCTTVKDAVHKFRNIWVTRRTEIHEEQISKDVLAKLDVLRADDVRLDPFYFAPYEVRDITVTPDYPTEAEEAIHEAEELAAELAEKTEALRKIALVVSGGDGNNLTPQRALQKIAAIAEGR